MSIQRHNSHNNESICDRNYGKAILNSWTTRVDLCFVAHKLIIKIDEDVHLYHENNEIRQTLIENLGFTFIKINPDPDPDAGFNLDVEIVKHFWAIRMDQVFH